MTLYFSEEYLTIYQALFSSFQPTLSNEERRNRCLLGK